MKNNKFYYATAFISGMCIMGVELSASRLLSPYFGTTNLIWSIIICLIMVGTSIGYYLGGKKADKSETVIPLYKNLIICGVWVLLIPLISNVVIIFTLFISNVISPINVLLIGAFLSSLIMFLFPLLLLGMVSPFLAKYCINDLTKTGSVIGKISLFTTIGSIIGTLLPSFVLIPLLGVKRTFIFWGIILIVLGISSNILFKHRVTSTIVKLGLIIVVAVALTSTSLNLEGKPICEAESQYNYLCVKEKNNELGLYTNNLIGTQSIYINDGKNKTGYYYDYLLPVPLFLADYSKQDEIKVLMIGYGTGTLYKLMDNYFSNLKITGVEIDQKVMDLAEDYFDYNKKDVSVLVEDGRNYLYKNSKRQNEKYDIIIIDVYQDISLPLNFTTQEFFKLCKENLKDNGVVAMNVALGNRCDSVLVESLGQTLKSTMNSVYCYKSEGDSNVIVVGSDRSELKENFFNNIANVEDDNIKDIGEKIKKSIVKIDKDEIVVTDDKNNLEIIQQKALAGILKDELDTAINFKINITFGQSGK
ncbi:fused MFS/spermidine synthase [Anaerocolumna sp. AGMB13025]|uniref:spermidine synthase n=1 Tax=Anaerocolumna sp. AGMB13025 TaxID=3039116 RepID=UPI00241D7C11|nr:fused MFS/spermidine synthase [Anaerocolumna sp. AGMB13025]WFR56118.1 fused MFS/spermidine synthase [Anaerocolumna sp. AGMB13025]